MTSTTAGIRIIAVHLDGGTELEHITEVEWENLEWGNTGESTTEDFAMWLSQDEENRALVGDSDAIVDVVHSPTGSTWLQAVDDSGCWVDTLLALPKY